MAARRLSSFEPVTMPVHISTISTILTFLFQRLPAASFFCLLRFSRFNHTNPSCAFSLFAHRAFANKLTRTSPVQVCCFNQSRKSSRFAFSLLFAHHYSSAIERTNLHEQSWPKHILNHAPPPMTRTGNPTLSLVYISFTSIFP